MGSYSEYNVLGIRYSEDKSKTILCLESNNNYYEIEFSLITPNNSTSLAKICNCFSKKVTEFQEIDIIPLEEMIIKLPHSGNNTPFFYTKENRNELIIKNNNNDIIFEYKRNNGCRNGYFVWNDNLFEDLRQL